MKNRKNWLIKFGAVVLFAATSNAYADKTLDYEVKITNLTKGLSFTPQFVATHSANINLFSLGEPASLAVEALAEAGDTSGVSEILESSGEAKDLQTVPGLLGPGQTVIATVKASIWQNKLSIMAMLLPTNDTFVAIDGLSLPWRGSKTVYALGYDAGTETNDQNCANIPGPRCGGVALSEGDYPEDEGFIYVSNGFHDLGEQDELGNEILQPKDYDWRNPVAKIEIIRVK